jgi:hypothetical protein
MNPEDDPPILKAFPDTRYFSQARLVAWHPRGLFDEHLANRVVEFIETEERIADQPFHRFTDLDGLTEIRLKIGHAFTVAERRRTGYTGEPVKSAFFSERFVGFGIAHMYEVLMEGAQIQVRAFRSCKAAADWLGVPLEILRPPDGTRDILQEGTI